MWSQKVWLRYVIEHIQGLAGKTGYAICCPSKVDLDLSVNINTVLASRLPKFIKIYYFLVVFWHLILDFGALFGLLCLILLLFWLIILDFLFSFVLF